MSPRRTGSSSFAPQSVIVELHEFAGRWFLTDRWGSGSGVTVRQPPRKTALGKAVLGRVEAARSTWRTAMTDADEAELWAHFCADEAGVPVDRYHPEKRIVILAGQVGISCRDARKSPPAWEKLPTKSPRKLGKALIKRLSDLEPPSVAAGAAAAEPAATEPPAPESAPSD